MREMRQDPARAHRGVVHPTQGDTVSDLDEMGPIDYVVIEWPGQQPTGEGLPLLVDLVDQGIIRIIDLMFITKDADGALTVLDLDALDETVSIFRGVSSGVLGEDEVAEAGDVLEPGTSAAILVWENRWAAPFASAVRRNGGQLVASGRIPVQDLIAALDAVEQTT
jgi:hypothetical protein